jgi:hypothetical protein
MNERAEANFIYCWCWAEITWLRSPGGAGGLSRQGQRRDTSGAGRAEFRIPEGKKLISSLICHSLQPCRRTGKLDGVRDFLLELLSNGEGPP